MQIINVHRPSCITFAVIILSVAIDELRNWTLAAIDAGLTNGEYVFIYVNQLLPDRARFDFITSTAFYTTGDGRDEEVKNALSSFLIVSFISLLIFISNSQTKSQCPSSYTIIKYTNNVNTL